MGNNKQVIQFKSEDLKNEAVAQGKLLVNCCMQGAKEAAGNIVYRGVHLFFDYLIELLNVKMSEG